MNKLWTNCAAGLAGLLLGLGIKVAVAAGADDSEALRRLEQRLAALERVLVVGPDGTSLLGPDTRLLLGRDRIELRARTFAVQASDMLSLRNGDADGVVELRRGLVQIGGREIEIQARDNVEVKASRDVRIKGTPIRQN